jgi:hypothetical protein
LISRRAASLKSTICECSMPRGVIEELARTFSSPKSSANTWASGAEIAESLWFLTCVSRRDLRAIADKRMPSINLSR